MINALKHYLVSGLIAVIAILTIMWRHAADEAQDYKDMAKLQGEIIATQTRITEHEQELDTRTQPIIQRIMEAPSASTPIPQDIAQPWADSIDSVRDARSVDGTGTKLQRPSSDPPGGPGFDSWPSPNVLGPTGSSIPKVRLSTTTSIKHR